jgi:ABC-type nitrate/sulfonate/bicarbonate transport system substrate-binding protein
MVVFQRMKRVLLGIATSIVVLGAAAPATAQPQQISVIVFPGGFNWPTWIAQDKGFFARGNVEVTLTNTPNSVFQLTGLIDGKFDIAMTAIDNAVAYMEGQGEAPVTAQPDLVAFMGSDNGFLSLTVQPDVKTYQDLKGRTVSVDAMTTGYAFVLLDMLERNGLKKGDYEVVRAGGVLSRFEALKEGKHAGTMLLTPFELVAKASGLNVLQYAIDVYGRYQGLVAASRRDWAQQNRPKVEAYIRGFVAAVDWLQDPANKREAIAILRKNLPQMSPQLAEETYGILAGPKGFTPKGRVDVEGIKTVLALRSKYGQPQKMLNDPMKYYDAAFYEAAMK